MAKCRDRYIDSLCFKPGSIKCSCVSACTAFFTCCLLDDFKRKHIPFRIFSFKVTAVFPFSDSFSLAAVCGIFRPCVLRFAPVMTERLDVLKFVACINLACNVDGCGMVNVAFLFACRFNCLFYERGNVYCLNMVGIIVTEEICNCMLKALPYPLEEVYETMSELRNRPFLCLSFKFRVVKGRLVKLNSKILKYVSIVSAAASVGAVALVSPRI